MRIEPNTLLAVATGNALALLVASAALFGEPDQLVKYIIIAVVVPVALVPLNTLWRRKTGMPHGPMIHVETPTSVLWSAVFPAVIALAAVVPFLMPLKDYGLLVLAASVWFGLTVDSAIRARHA